VFCSEPHPKGSRLPDMLSHIKLTESFLFVCWSVSPMFRDRSSFSWIFAPINSQRPVLPTTLEVLVNVLAPRTSVPPPQIDQGRVFRPLIPRFRRLSRCCCDPGYFIHFCLRGFYISRKNCLRWKNLGMCCSLAPSMGCDFFLCPLRSPLYLAVAFILWFGWRCCLPMISSRRDPPRLPLCFSCLAVFPSVVIVPPSPFGSLRSCRFVPCRRKALSRFPFPFDHYARVPRLCEVK